MINLNKINNLIELFIKQYENQENKNTILLSSLAQPVQNYSWQTTVESVYKLSNDLKKYVSIGDRCLLISENRPEWFITCLLYTSPSPRDSRVSRMPSSA